MKTARRLEPKWLLIIVFFVSGVFLGALGIFLFTQLTLVSSRKIHSTQKYQYINPLLAVDAYGNKNFGENTSLQIEVTNLIENLKRDGNVYDAAIYFRDIEPGIWIGIEEDAQFSPGKLLKVPIMIAYFKLAESNPDILDESMVFRRDNVTPEDSLHRYTPLTDGSNYTVYELIKKMIIEYNDDAAFALFDHIDKTALDEVFSDLGIGFKEDRFTQDYISLKLYSIFYRVLYNATYLNRDYSEKALELISSAGDMAMGTASDIPKSIPVVHRVSGYKPFNKKGFVVYDCGITYYPQHPYLLCANVIGKDQNSAVRLLQQVGEKIYQETDYKYHSQ